MTNHNVAPLLTADEHKNFMNAMDVIGEINDATKQAEPAHPESTPDGQQGFMPMDEVDLATRVADAETSEDLTAEDWLTFYERYGNSERLPDAAFKEFKEDMAKKLAENERRADMLDADEQPENIAVTNEDSDKAVTTTSSATTLVTVTGNTDAHAGRRVSKNVTHKRDGIADLVKLDKTGRARYESGLKKGRNIKGRFMTKHELDLIEDHQELIRGGIADDRQGKFTPDPTQRTIDTQEKVTPDFTQRTADMDKQTRDAYFANLAALRAKEQSSPRNGKLRKAGKAAVAALMNAAAKEARTKQLRPETPNVPHASATESSRKLDEFTKSEWFNMLNIEEQARAVERFTAEGQTTKSQTSQTIKRPESIPESAWDMLTIEEQERAKERLADKPVEGKAFWNRIRSRIGKTDEKGKTEIKIPRKAVAAVVTGALAVTALFASSMPKDGEVQAKAPQTVGNQAYPENNPALVKAPAKKVEASAKKIVHKVVHEAAPHTVTFKKGDTIWHAAEMELKKQGINHATPAQIDGLADHLRAINGHLTEKQAKNLPVGYKLKVDK